MFYLYLLFKDGPQVPRFASSNPAVVDGFFQGVKVLRTSAPGGTLSFESRSLTFSGSLKCLCEQFRHILPIYMMPWKIKAAKLN